MKKIKKSDSVNSYKYFSKFYTDDEFHIMFICYNKKITLDTYLSEGMKDIGAGCLVSIRSENNEKDCIKNGIIL